FKKREGIEKHYLALVVGCVEKDQLINIPLRKDAQAKMVKVDKLENGALEAKSKIHVQKRLKEYTLLDVQLLTGRTHQIRVHMNAIGHPVVGDGKYGDFKDNRLFKETFNYDSQFLHAYLLKFNVNQGVLAYLNGRTFESSLPEKELEILNVLSNKEN
ncbi:MAG: RNA pseudouridine synthase, partial [Bacilli bacterium]|nr:RNA pseudouridine synthase [Bacilli bacterium]